jgi:hypothetical protein
MLSEGFVSDVIFYPVGIKRSWHLPAKNKAVTCKNVEEDSQRNGKKLDGLHPCIKTGRSLRSAVTEKKAVILFINFNLVFDI